ncbi:universal stress protein [Paenibacillus agricola]|uniref:Universal stress protein n=1 Tax=Paenibacillus agricola TaxID=2716264 RepID=A0ABX0J608_9BACL|nr:universal stress protein [Paenibacillus agricola]NHN29499.1 universal stress protein [Paenibacillus agricola]
MSFQHILVAYDGSELSKKALHKAIALVTDSPAKLEVVYVLHNPVIVIGESVIPTTAHFEAGYLDESQAMLEHVDAEIAHLPNAKTTLLQGSPSDVMVSYAKAEGADLIVIGSRGLSDFKELFLGSVSHYVVQHAEVPVLVVK